MIEVADWMREFAERADRAEKAAATFDGPALDRATAELSGWVETIREVRPNGELLLQVRSRLEQYRERCRFMVEALADAIGQGGQNRARYGGTGTITDMESRSVLVEKYG